MHGSDHGRYNEAQHNGGIDCKVEEVLLLKVFLFIDICDGGGVITQSESWGRKIVFQ